MLNFFLFCLVALLFIGFCALCIGIAALVVAIVIRVWPNYITPWLDRHFGETDW